MTISFSPSNHMLQETTLETNCCFYLNKTSQSRHVHASTMGVDVLGGFGVA